MFLTLNAWEQKTKEFVFGPQRVKRLFFIFYLSHCRPLPVGYLHQHNSQLVVPVTRFPISVYQLKVGHHVIILQLFNNL